MSEPEHQRRASELGRLWQGQVIPVEEEAATAEQKARVVPSIASAIGRAAASRRKGLRLRKLLERCRSGLRARAAASAASANDKDTRLRRTNGVRALSGVVTR
jgi:hypothetical protein